MKKLDTVLKEYVARFSLDNLKYLVVRLEDRMPNDLAEALNLCATYPDLDKWLKTATCSEEFYDMLDTLQEYTCRELNKRAPDLQAA